MTDTFSFHDKSGTITVETNPEPRTFSFYIEGELLFTIEHDGTIVRGPSFTTNDEMSLKFWEMVDRMRKPWTQSSP